VNVSAALSMPTKSCYPALASTIAPATL